MEKDYIIIAGRKYRVEANWNALSAFLRSFGADLSVLTRALSMPEWTELLVASVREGQRLDGDEPDMTAQIFGQLLPIDALHAITEFQAIYLRQNAADPAAADEDKKKA